MVLSNKNIFIDYANLWHSHDVLGTLTLITLLDGKIIPAPALNDVMGQVTLMTVLFQRYHLYFRLTCRVY